MADAPKIKGVVDIVILLDVTGSMQECIDAVKGSIGNFINTLSTKDANNENPIKDWRIKVCGYRDQQQDPEGWFINNPFVREVEAVKTYIAAENMQARSGGDEPESLLDALYKLANMEEAGIQDGDCPDKWRALGTASRVVIFFTDATFKNPMTLAEASGGSVVDVGTGIMAKRIGLFGFVPEWEGYEALGTIDKAQVTFVATKSESPALAGLGKTGEEGRAAQKAAVSALAAKAGDPVAFGKIMEQLAKTVSKVSALPEAC